jgi:hypothetical protein
MGLPRPGGGAIERSTSFTQHPVRLKTQNRLKLIFCAVFRGMTGFNFWTESAQGTLLIYSMPGNAPTKLSWLNNKYEARSWAWPSRTSRPLCTPRRFWAAWLSYPPPPPPHPPSTIHPPPCSQPAMPILLPSKRTCSRSQRLNCGERRGPCAARGRTRGSSQSRPVAAPFEQGASGYQLFGADGTAALRQRRWAVRPPAAWRSDQGPVLLPHHHTPAPAHFLPPAQAHPRDPFSTSPLLMCPMRQAPGARFQMRGGTKPSRPKPPPSLAPRDRASGRDFVLGDPNWSRHATTQPTTQA